MGMHMKAAFVSNYINHHQIPFCNEMYRLMKGEFTFIQTEAMEAERVKMGWHEAERPAYVKCWYEEPELCRRLVMECDAVIFGGTDDESFIRERLKSGKLVLRYSERLYKTGQWKAVSPRGLRKKFLDHTRYRNARVYLLCAGAYVPSDFHIVRAYPGKMYCWGYFPETRRYDPDDLLAGKGWELPEARSCGTDALFERKGWELSETHSYDPDALQEGKDRKPASGGKVPYLLWAARMIGWKHPELALETARYLKEHCVPFHLDMIGDGELRQDMEELCRCFGLEEQVRFLGFHPPEQVRKYMEQADIFLATSDRQEGWGAVVNEAMNSGCALVADHMIGAAPYLVCDGANGFVYRDHRPRELFARVRMLAEDRELCRRLGRNAYRTIAEVWNAENAAARLLELIEKLLSDTSAGRTAAESFPLTQGCFRGALSPCAPAPILSEHGAGRLIGRSVGKETNESDDG